jgi:hypothetical protein
MSEGVHEVRESLRHSKSTKSPGPPSVAEAFFSSLEWEVLSRQQLTDPHHAKAVVLLTGVPAGVRVLL